MAQRLSDKQPDVTSVNANTHPSATGGKSQFPEYHGGSKRPAARCPCLILNNEDYPPPLVPAGVGPTILGLHFRSLGELIDTINEGVLCA